MDKQQFVSAIGGMQESLRRFLLVLTHGDEELANDLAQEAILKAYLHCGPSKAGLRCKHGYFVLPTTSTLTNKIPTGKPTAWQ